MILSTPAGTSISVAELRQRAAGFGVPVPLAGQGATAQPANASVVASGTAHVKGAWVELVTSTTVDADGVVVYIGATSTAATDTSTLLDIGIGAAGSEVVIVPDLQVGHRNTNSGQGNRIEYVLPVRVPRGSRIAARCQSAVTSKSIPTGVSLVSFPEATAIPSKLINLGADAATSNGPTVTSGGSSNTKGSWVEIGTTNQPLRGLVVSTGNAAGNTNMANGFCAIDVGVGASGAQQVILSDLHLLLQANEHILQCWPSLLPCRIPSGTKVWLRNAGDGASRAIGAVVIGVPA